MLFSLDVWGTSSQESSLDYLQFCMHSIVASKSHGAYLHPLKQGQWNLNLKWNMRGKITYLQSRGMERLSQIWLWKISLISNDDTLHNHRNGFFSWGTGIEGMIYLESHQSLEDVTESSLRSWWQGPGTSDARQKRWSRNKMDMVSEGFLSSTEDNKRPTKGNITN